MDDNKLASPAKKKVVSKSKAAEVAEIIDIHLKRISEYPTKRWSMPRSWTYDNRRVMIQYTWSSASCMPLAEAEKYIVYLEEGGKAEHFNVDDSISRNEQSKAAVRKPQGSPKKHKTPEKKPLSNHHVRMKQRRKGGGKPRPRGPNGKGIGRDINKQEPDFPKKRRPIRPPEAGEKQELVPSEKSES
jgi:hypothetical protein